MGPVSATRATFAVLVAGLVVGACLAGAQMRAAQYVPPAPEQPLPFSHRRHLAMDLACRTCHEMPEPGDQATLPATATCMGCHVKVGKDSQAIQQLAEFHNRGEAIPWRRVYRLPEFVSFSHTQHVTDAGVACEVCHGPVREMERMQRVKDISMAACVSCHEEKAAPVGCGTCHDPL